MHECLNWEVCKEKGKKECDGRGNIRLYDLTAADNPIELEGIKGECEYYEPKDLMRK